MSHGGKREGSGRKKEKRTLDKEKAREYIIEQVVKNIRPIIKVLIEKSKKGDLQAIKELFDRGFGRPAQSMELPPGSGSFHFEWSSESQFPTPPANGQ